MAEKCTVCNEKIETTFLEKIRGTYIRKGKKLEAICSNCQKKLKNNSDK
ncbi:hypothetical protein J4476_02280 [Candidatus Woesearchaeota archaeon]|nr:hypothetical protein [Candidatus Woesearchaeota archaeon]HIH25457.1 hypothetical protein [Nanoarchaeota archaeon]